MMSQRRFAAENMSTLPKWAQEHIAMLERNLEGWKAKATAGPANSNTFLRNGTPDPTPLGDSPWIQFGTDADEALAVRLVGESIYVQGMGPITVRPRGGTVVSIERAT